MANITEKMDALGLEYVHAGGNEIRLNCPFCQNNKKKLWINTVKRIGQCFRCGATGTARYFLKQFGIKLEDEYKKFALELPKESVEAKKIELPKEFRPIKHDTLLGCKAYDYLIEKRGLVERDIELYNIGYCPTGNYTGYVIIPVYDYKGELEAWQGRKYCYAGPKSMNPPGGRGNFFGFINNLSINYCIGGDIVLVEGPFDAIKLNNTFRSNYDGPIFYSLALLGHSLSNKQMSILKYEIKPRTVYLMLDWDVNDEEIMMAKQLHDFGFTDIRTSQLKEQDGDPDELKEYQLYSRLIFAEKFDVTKVPLDRLMGI